MSKRESSTFLNKKRIIAAFVIFAVLLLLLCIRTGYLQIVKGNELSKLAVEQQTSDEVIKPKRGSIYDRNGNELAVNTEAYSVWVRAGEMKTGKTKEEKQENYEKTMGQLAEILGEDKDELIKKVDDAGRTLLKVSKSVDRETADEIRNKDLTGVSLNEEVKRYYPMGDFLSHTLGSVTDDNTGLSGIELAYDSYLSGVQGRWVKSTDISGNLLVDGTEKYYKPQDGSNVVLTIDQVIQNYTEKSVKEAYEKYGAERVSCIVMETKTGEILSMASAPSFDPNNSRVPTDEKEAKEFAKLSSSEQMAYLNNMWRNPLISDVYEPGSTVKLITTSAALEESITKKSEKFTCKGYYEVTGIKVNCVSASYGKTHGTENLYESVYNSCNPVFMQLALRLGKDKFYDYLELFGLTEKTGIDFPGEASPIILNKDKATQLDLGVMGFGQTNAVTPIQMITAVSALGNGGKVMEPHIVKEITDSDGKTTETIKPKTVRQAVSEETATEMLTIMEGVVENTTQKAKVAGYRVGGKTGTSEVVDKEKGGYTDDVIASFVGMVPIDDPEYTILYIIDKPAAGAHGGAIAAPESSKLLEKILKYADIKPNYSESDKTTSSTETVSVPNVTGKKLSEAKKILSKKGLKYIISPEMKTESEFVVKDQYPKSGDKTNKNGIVYLYRE